jgi:hypothetical protein
MSEDSKLPTRSAVEEFNRGYAKATGKEMVQSGNLRTLYAASKPVTLPKPRPAPPENETAMHRLAARVMAVGDVNWSDGMLPLLLLRQRWVRGERIDAAHTPPDVDAVPDLEDTATLGCIYAQVMALWAVGPKKATLSYRVRDGIALEWHMTLEDGEPLAAGLIPLRASYDAPPYVQAIFSALHTVRIRQLPHVSI